MSYNLKYLKYKQKYLDLKKLIGAGLEATCELNEKNIIITYNLDGEKELYYEYNPEDSIGSGTYGTVYKIKKLSSDDDTEYILKMKKPGSSEIFRFKGMINYNYPIVKEGIQSNLLDGILDNESLIIFQGKIMSNAKPVGEFLISRYNGFDLQKTYSGTKYFNQSQKIEYIGNILDQILGNIYKLNNSKLYHNDIKLQNIVMDSSMRVRLIDFGLLDTKSDIGTVVSMSYKSVNIDFYEYSDQKYRDIIDKLNPKLKDTDIFGFFYCCIDLLYLLNDKNFGFGSYTIFRSLGIIESTYPSLLILFNLYYLISPIDYRIEPIEHNTQLMLNTKLPDIYTTRQFFSPSIIDDNLINLYRYILFIYDFLVFKGIDQIIGEENLKNFLVGISVCLLPTFNYESFDFTNLCQYLVKKA
jgi:serine/threonine protein kinase